MKAALAEFIGTFTLVFIGAGAGALADVGSGGLVAVALAYGLALMVIVYTWGSISGAHVNPAVTLGVAFTGRMSSLTAVIYWTAQFLGGVAAAYLLAYLVGTEGGLGQTIGSLTPNVTTSGPNASAVKTIVVEAVLTFFLMTSVFASGVLNKNGNLAGVAIGLVLTMDIIMGGTLTGASMNPARTFGPAVVMRNVQNMDYFWMYLIGPFIGATVGALLYDQMFSTKD
jgi:MIP family channel proteins